MQTEQVLEDEALYNIISTVIFLGVVILLPLFLLISTPTLVFSVYGAIPFVLGLWTFLRGPENQIKQRKMESLSIKYPDIAEQITNLSVYTRLKFHPKILYIPSESLEVFTFGTWKKSYIAISEGAIANWADPKARINILTHEIAHIVRGDTWKTGFTIQYLYWQFGISILVIIRSFPYSLFFNIYDSFRFDNGIGDLVTSLTVIVLLFAVLLATRFLYRIKEYSADAFAKQHLGLSNYIEAFVLPLTYKPKTYNKKQRISFRIRLLKALGFHPSIQARLIALQSPAILINELPSLMFVAGLFLGYISGYDFTLDKSFALLISGEIIVGFLASSIVLIAVKKINAEGLNEAKTMLKSIFSLGNGAASAFIFLVGINNLLASNPAGKMDFRQGMELTDALFVTLDVLLLIAIIIPVLILSLALLLRLLIQRYINKESVWWQIFFTVTAFLPFIGLLCFYVVEWWKGSIIYYDKFPYFIFASILWILLTTWVWQVIPFWKIRFSKKEKK